MPPIDEEVETILAQIAARHQRAAQAHIRLVLGFAVTCTLAWAGVVVALYWLQ